MVYELIVPELGKIGKVKDFVIAILVKHWPLTLKEIYNRIKKEFRYSGSYQSVFKSVNELLQKKVLLKNGKSYEINVSWVKDLQSWTDRVETNYYASSKVREVLSGKVGDDVSILNFSSIFDAEKYLYYFVKSDLKKCENQKVVYEISNLWKVLFYYRAEYNYYTKLMKRGHVFSFFISGDSKIEEKAKKFYKKIGISVKNKKGSIIDSIIFGDYYIQMFVPESLQKKIRMLMDEGNQFELLKILDEDSNVKIIIHRDRDLVAGMLEKFK